LDSSVNLEMAFERLGISMLETTRAFGCANDFESTYNKDNKKTSEAKIKRAADKPEKLRTLYKETLLPKMAWMEHRSGVRMEMYLKRDEEAKRKEAIQEAEAAAEFALTGIFLN
jgi:hypothetical protein